MITRQGDRVRVMDPYRAVVECFRGTIKRVHEMSLQVDVVPDYDRGAICRVQVERPGVVLPLDDNRLCRWAA